MTAQPTSETNWQARARAEMPVLQRFVYLNSGTAGPLPQRAHDIYTETLRYELEAGRGNFAEARHYVATIERARALCARLLGADPDEIAMTHHTSDGIGIVLTAMPWQSGDRIVTTTLEHDAVCVPLGLLRQRHGVNVQFVDIGYGEAALDRLTPEVLAGARLLVLSHVVFTSGALLPLAEIAKRCQQANVPLLVDGAQTCGAQPLDVHALGVDFYTLSGQKWPCGPEGTGALYVRRDWIERLTPSRGSYFSPRRHDFRGNVELHRSARRFELAIVHRPSWAAFAASAQWILDEIGLERAWSHSLDLARQARERLSTLPGVAIITPADSSSQLLTFSLGSLGLEETADIALDLARQQQVVIRSTPTAPIALRASFGFFNDREDVDRLVEAISALV